MEERVGLKKHWEGKDGYLRGHQNAVFVLLRDLQSAPQRFASLFGPHQREESLQSSGYVDGGRESWAR